MQISAVTKLTFNVNDHGNKTNIGYLEMAIRITS